MDEQENMESTPSPDGANVAKKNWKADLPLGKVRPMPPSDYKKKLTK